MNYGEGLTNEYRMRNYRVQLNTPIGDYQTMNDNIRMDMARLEAKSCRSAGLCPESQK